jgi:hypothetical protein
MKRNRVAFAIIAALFLFSSGCVVTERPGDRRARTYYYYPDYEIYYYPHVERYYWRERGDWRYDSKPPPRFVLRERERVRIDSRDDPHNDHERVRKTYPPGRYDKR